MPGNFGLAELQSRKRALVEASEAQREVLLVEFDNLRLSATAFQRKLKLFSTVASGLGLVVPLVRSIFRFRGDLVAPIRKERSKRSLLGTALTGWRLYRKVAPVLQTFISRRF
jgi:hypothetical protein